MKRRILIITLLVAVLGGCAWLVLLPREPAFEGKSLSYWLHSYKLTLPDGVTNTPARVSAMNALHRIGTNAIPTLLRMLRAKDSPFRLKVIRWFGSQHFIKVAFVPATAKNLEAVLGFQILGAEAGSAVPELIHIVEEDISEGSRENAAASLGNIGPEAKPAIPALLGLVSDTRASPAERAEAIAALGQIHSEPERVIPVMLKGLKDADFIVRWFAMQGLGNFGPAARDAVPDLLQAVKSPNGMISIYAADALQKIDPEAAAKAGVK